MTLCGEKKNCASSENKESLWRINGDYLNTTLAGSVDAGLFLTSVFSRGLEETSRAHFPKTALR